MTLDEYPKMNSQDFRILDTSQIATIDKHAVIVPLKEAVAQFMYRGFEISFCTSAMFTKVYTAVLLNDEIVYNCDTVEQAINYVELILEEKVQVYEKYLHT
jgi:hypothetical protein